MKPQVDICIPVFYCGPQTPRILAILLETINRQTYENIMVCASLQFSGDGEGDYSMVTMFDFLETEYQFTTPQGRGCPANNTHAAMHRGEGKYIKIMNQDDFLDSPTTISEMVDELENNEARWLVNTCIHTDEYGEKRERLHHPYWPGEKGMVEGINRFGCPSVSMFERSVMPELDPGLLLCMDCDMWIQLYRKAGAPIIRNVPDVVVRMWENQLSNKLDYARALETDKVYLRAKYGYT